MGDAYLLVMASPYEIINCHCEKCATFCVPLVPLGDSEDAVSN
jgi:hypothetical protein